MSSRFEGRSVGFRRPRRLRCEANFACTVTAQTKDRFTESNFVSYSDTQVWAGESIVINIAGRGPCATMVASPSSPTRPTRR